jgi:hypothetical protein
LQLRQRRLRHCPSRPLLDRRRRRVPQALRRWLPPPEGARLPGRRRQQPQAPLRGHCRRLQGDMHPFKTQDGSR